MVMKQVSTYYQTGSIASLLSGCYDGDQTLRHVMQNGNFGLGTVDAVDGELVIDEGQCFHCDANGNAHIADANTKTPFCVVTDFKPLYKNTLQPFETIAELYSQLDHFINGQRNQMHALRIEAVFDTIHARSECGQPHPYKPLAQTLPKLQNLLEWRNIKGVLVITYFPSYMSSINAQGYHAHFISREQAVGGHVFDCKSTAECAVSHSQIKRVIMDSISNDNFNTTQIDAVSLANSNAVEKNAPSS